MADKFVVKLDDKPEKFVVKVDAAPDKERMVVRAGNELTSIDYGSISDFGLDDPENVGKTFKIYDKEFVLTQPAAIKPMEGDRPRPLVVSPSTFRFTRACGY